MSDNIFICKICNKAFSSVFSFVSHIANEKEHFYFPDFKIGNELIEIKGDHFFDKNGNFRCPFNILDEKIQNEYKAKYECMLNNNIKIMRKK